MNDQLKAMADGLIAALSPFESDLDPVQASALRLAREWLREHEPKPQPEGTVRVRIAVAVNEKGEWSSAGWHKCEDKYLASSALEGLDGFNGTAEAVHLVVADVPKPVSSTIQGEVAR